MRSLSKLYVGANVDISDFTDTIKTPAGFITYALYDIYMILQYKRFLVQAVKPSSIIEMGRVYRAYLNDTGILRVNSTKSSKYSVNNFKFFGNIRPTVPYHNVIDDLVYVCKFKEVTPDFEGTSLNLKKLKIDGDFAINKLKTDTESATRHMVVEYAPHLGTMDLPGVPDIDTTVIFHTVRFDKDLHIQSLDIQVTLRNSSGVALFDKPFTVDYTDIATIHNVFNEVINSVKPSMLTTSDMELSSKLIGKEQVELRRVVKYLVNDATEMSDVKTATPMVTTDDTIFTAEGLAPKTLTDEVDSGIAEETKPKEDYKAKKDKTVVQRLIDMGVSPELLKQLSQWRKDNGLDPELEYRVPKPSTLFEGGRIFNIAIAAILSGRNILLEGTKATGKNTLADNLAWLFGRPKWDISFHTHSDASSLIGSDTFKGGDVMFNPAGVYLAMQHGGFVVLDELNMAKPDAMAILHPVLDDRRAVDVPGYNYLKANSAFRVIATMNYGYAGTKRLNEALGSRFVVISMPTSTPAQVRNIITSKHNIGEKDSLLLSKLFMDLDNKARTGNISSTSVDLRGILDAIELSQYGIAIRDALEVTIINKVFDEYERDIVRDVVKTLFVKDYILKVLEG